MEETLQIINKMQPMSDLMDKILADKAKTRKEPASLPFDKKLAMMEKIRRRSALLAENLLRKQKPPAGALASIAGLRREV